MDHPPATIRGRFHGSRHHSPVITPLSNVHVFVGSDSCHCLIMSAGIDRPPPDAASLREAALRYLARYATTEAGLRKTLHRRIDNWAWLHPDRDETAAAKRAVPGIVTQMVELGLINDTAFAESRARRLALNGRSRVAISAALAAKGIGSALTEAVLPRDNDVELAAALILTRKRRIGPFRNNAENRTRELGVMARAGFPRDIASRALAMAPDDAEAAITAAKS